MILLSRIFCPRSFASACITASIDQGETILRLLTAMRRIIIRILPVSASFGVCMKPATFKLDRRVFELLKDGNFQQFTIRGLRAAYAGQQDGSFSDVELWRYIYDQVRRLKRVGWIRQDVVRRRRDQVFHVLGKPTDLSVSLIENTGSSGGEPCADDRDKGHDVLKHPDLSATLRLESLAKEIRLDMLTALGEAERYKQLFTEMPDLRVRVEEDYLDARDRSSRLLGHLRAIENTLKTLVAA
ncbi:Uncharacterized protein PPKH_5087 [Pseudomonas putida]|nr:Uncharacterized protein PPKH_5087 [Pseudomonas putida]